MKIENSYSLTDDNRLARAVARISKIAAARIIERTLSKNDVLINLIN